MIQGPQFRPSATPVTTAVAPGAPFAAPMPVQAPQAQAPTAPVLPTAPKPYDDSFIRSLHAFGSSVGALGGALQEMRVKDTEKAAAAAESSMATMTLDEATSYADKVKLENKSKSLVDGTLRAYGSTLASKLMTDPALVGMNGQQASDYITQKTAEYRDRFKSETFDKAFAPVAERLVTSFKSQALQEKTKQSKDVFLQAINADINEFRTHTVGLPADEQTKAVQDYVDETIDKKAKEANRALEPAELNGIYKNIASFTASKGDVIATRAILTKSRGGNPALADFDPEAKSILKAAEDQQQFLAKDQLAKDAVRYDLAADKGTFRSQPEFKGKTEAQITEQLVERGYNPGAIAAWHKTAQAGADAAFFQANQKTYLQLETALSHGDLANGPSVHNPMHVRLYGGTAQIVAAQKRGTEALANEWKSHKGDLQKAAISEATDKLAATIAGGGSAAFAAIAKTEVAIADGSTHAVNAEDLQKRVMAFRFQMIADDPRNRGDAGVIANKQTAALIESSYLPEKMKNAIVNGASASSFRGVTAKTPEERATVFAAQKQGLDIYRGLIAHGGLPTLEANGISKQQQLFYDALDFYSNAQYGGDDYKAAEFLAISSNKPANVIQDEVNHLNLAQRKETLQNYAIKAIPGRAVSVDTSIVKAQVSNAADALVRMGIDADTAIKIAGPYFARAYTSHEGLVVPKNADPTYKEVQDFVKTKIVEQNRDSGIEADHIALVPSVAADYWGRSGVHALRDTNTGAPVVVNGVEFKLRDGGVLKLDNPSFIDLADVRKIKEAMQFENEQTAVSSKPTSAKIDIFTAKGPELGALYTSGAAEYQRVAATGASDKDAMDAAMRYLIPHVKDADPGESRFNFTDVEGKKKEVLANMRSSLTWAVKQSQKPKP
ncbi:hypothetical protein UFOVP823_27 [uncultured Caudovirales phage]|uniref:Uncharacterized protein n=1 Tax=uncultured Caudovirales phage TaxID=2100421 RepID=A0A6J5PCM8_9CAUD|nr:hypothetical protein UFOVP823_27 [uncultured Caudovirales phage]